MDLSSEEEKIKNDAIAFARKHKKEIAHKLTSTDVFQQEDDPVSVFMAGSPGAGKTEASIALLESKRMEGTNVLRIDADELREEFPDYTGGNSWLFQAAASILVDKIHDFALKQKQSFLLDGTLSKYDIAEKNIERSLKKKRFVQILYVYQSPQAAWEFVLAREAKEGRRILPEHFIEQYFAARKVVNALKSKFGKALSLDLLLKENDGTDRLYKAGVDQIDYHIPEKYTETDILNIISKPLS